MLNYTLARPALLHRRTVALLRLLVSTVRPRRAMLAKLCGLMLLVAVSEAKAGGGLTCGLTYGNIGFPNFDPLSATPTDVIITYTMACTVASTPFSVAFDNGLYGTAATWRKMASTTTNSTRIEYNLYSDSARSTVLTNTGTLTTASTTTGVPNNYQLTFPIYGRIRPGPQQTQSTLLFPGNYSDTITLTATW